MTVVPEFSNAKILVVGDIMLDRYWSGQAARISPEAPVPVVRIKNIEDRIGGAGNVALNIAKLGGQVTLLGVVGNDEDGEIIRNNLETHGVRCDFVTSDSSSTICKLRVMAQHQQLIRVDFENSPLIFNKKTLLKKLIQHLSNKQAVVFSDYGKGTLEDVGTYINQAKQAGAKVLVDPKGIDYQCYANADIITPNISEFQSVMGSCENEVNLLSKGKELLNHYQIETLLLTRSEAGMTLIQENNSQSIPAQAKDVFDVTGAGDTAIAVMSLGVALNLPMYEAMYLSIIASGIVVGKLGTATVSVEELTRAMHGNRESKYGVVTEDELAELLAIAKANGELIVMTNGCFDLLHAGHVTYLEQAKALGGRLVVAVNSDQSVKQLKGDSRPINALPERMIVLAALACVDWVVKFEEETPERLCCRLLPDILVKGGDYKPEEVAGGQCVIKAGGEVKILEFVDGQSTTAMINRAKVLR